MCFKSLSIYKKLKREIINKIDIVNLKYLFYFNIKAINFEKIAFKSIK